MKVVHSVEFTTGPRFDRYGEIRFLASVNDKSARRTWIIAKRKGGSSPSCLSVDEWMSLAATEAGACAPMAARLSIYGIV